MNHTKFSPVGKKKGTLYDVALSFAEEDRPFVDRVAAHLKEKGVRIFYDKDEMIFSWGKDLDGYLDDTYRKKSRYCVMFISKHYKQKRWTRHERVRAQARSFEEHREYILPFRFDDTEIEEVRGEIVYLSVKEYDELRLANAIFDKIERDKTTYHILVRRMVLFLSHRPGKLLLLLITTCAMMLLFSDKITPVDILTKRLHERSREKLDGAVCADSTYSTSRGKGTCSHHGGVAYYKDSTVYHKSYGECEKEAKATTLLAP